MTVPFVTALRTRTDPVRVGDMNDADRWTLRVQSAEAWDAVKVEAAPSALVRDVKRAAMAVLMPDIDATEHFVVKLRGFAIADENISLRGVGAMNGSTLLVTSIRRRPVR